MEGAGEKEGEEMTRSLTLVEIAFTTHPRAVTGFGVDLYWKGTGWFYIYRDGRKIGVNHERQFWSRHEGKLAVFQEREAGE